MVRLIVGVVGPSDLVPPVADLVDATPGIVAIRLVYRHERDAPTLLRQHTGAVDAWLFTGVVPHEISRQAGVIDKPAEHVSYGGVSLLGALLRLVREGRDVTELSIDTLESHQVAETLAEAGIATDSVSTMANRPDVRSRDVVEFHRTVRKQRPGTVAVTCLRSAYLALRGEMPVVRLTPSSRDTRLALESLLLSVQSRHHSDAQVALGLVDLEHDDDKVTSDFAALGGTVVRIDTGRYLLVATRGPLERITAGLTAAPFLAGLAARHQLVRVGFGLGRSASAAATHASRALGQARRHGPVAAVVTISADTDILLHRSSPSGTPTDPGVLAQRLGISRQTLNSLHEVVRVHGGQVTSRDVASVFGIQDRSARRLLKRLERGGVAQQISTAADGQVGRPAVVYQVDL